MTRRSTLKIFAIVTAFIVTVGLAVVTPAGATSGWTVTPSPSPTGQPTAGLTSVACTSDTNCFAVGYSGVTATDSEPVQAAVIEHWNGSVWSVETLPLPSQTSNAILAGVACPDTDDCFAVGSTDDDSAALIEHWDGTSWSEQPGAGLSDGQGDPSTSGHLDGVWCQDATDCIAVGDFHIPGTYGLLSLAEQWNGTTWSAVDSPVPDGAVRATLDAVSCQSMTSCIAVGDSDTGTVQSPLAESWDGTSWSIMSTPNEPGSVQTALTGIACPQANRCFASGWSYDLNADTAFVETWNGTAWSIAATPEPSGSVSDILNAVECLSTTNCLAVGAWNGSYTLVEHWNGSSWAVWDSPTPKTSVDAQLNGVTCTNTHSCYAVGYVDDAMNSLVEHWDGTALWQAGFTPRSSQSEFDDVSCASSVNCMAVGDFFTGPVNHTLAERWNGTTWSPVAIADPSGGYYVDLTSIACPSSTSCWAVGFYESDTTPASSVIEHWNGTRWSVVSNPNGDGLTGVSCASATSCLAVGDRNGRTLIERWNGTVWSILANPDPDPGSAFLESVACASASSCTAVGHDGSLLLVERWNGSTWSVTSPYGPAGGSALNFTDVSCKTAQSCIAVGSFDSGSSTRALAERWNGTTWSVTPVPAALDSTGAELLGTTCETPTSCYAVGDSAFGGDSAPLIVHWNGTNWSIVTSADPSGATAATLHDVACTSTATCLAVGSYGANDSNYTLAERSS